MVDATRDEMKDKQLTLKQVIKEIGAGRCLKCKAIIDLSITYHWRMPLCKKCRLEILEDLDEFEN